jgi:hypothetical protein
LDAKFLRDELGHDLPRPQSKMKAILARILPNNPTAHLLALLGGKLGLLPARRALV